MTAGGSLRRILRLEVLPDPGGLVSFGLLVAVVAGYLVLRPDAEGGVAGVILDLLPEGLRGPRTDVAVDGLFQAVLAVGPGACAWAAGRHISCRGDSLLPCFTLAGGGLLTLLTLAGIAVAAIGG